MTEREILNKVTDKAIANGWDGMVRNAMTDDGLPQKVRYNFQPYEVTIFDHSFAKAFWGEDNYCSVCEVSGHVQCGYPDTGNDYKAWEYHLQEIVLEENPIRYLERFL